MNKENAIQKINKTGNIGRIICIIFNVCIGIITGLCLIASITFTALPKDFLSVTTSSSASTAINLSMFMQEQSQEQKEATYRDIENSINESVTAEVNNGIAKVNGTVDENGVLTVDTDIVTYSMTLRSLASTLLLAAFITALAFISTFFAGRLCKAFSVCQSPFDADVIKKLRHFAFSLIPWTISASFFVFETGPSTAISKFNLNVNFGMVFITLAVLGLSFIFKYGAILQQESDETL